MANVESAIDFGDLPTGWSLVPVRSIVRKRRKLVGTNSASYKLLSLTLRGVIVRDLSGMKGKFPATFETYQEVEPGDLVLCMFDVEETPRTVGLSRHFGMITGAYDVYRSDDAVALEYLTRLLLVLDENKALAPLYRGLRKTIPRAAFESLKVPMPTKEEQGLIVRYLDHAELRIAKAIAAKQRVLSLLQEHKLAKFETAVFGVADGEYSDAASSHPWMGDIPKHWKVVRAKSILKLLSRSVDLSSETVTCFRDGTVTKRSNRGKIGFTESIYFSGYQGVEPGDLVVHQMDAFAGAIGVSDSAGKCTPVYAICKVDAAARPEFIAILLKLMARRGWVTALSRGIRVRSTDFRFPVLATQYLPLPPVEEQDAMLVSLAKATEDIASAITAVSTEIALLKEYRTRLISDVVTGKMDVRDEAAKLPEIDPMELSTVAVGENGDEEEATDDD